MMFIALAAGFNKAESSRVVLFLNLGPKWLKKFSEVLYAVIVIGFFGFSGDLRLGAGYAAENV